MDALFDLLFFCSDGVGMQTLIRQSVGSSLTDPKITLGFEIFKKDVETDQGDRVSLLFWNLSEKHQFDRVNNMRYRNKHGALIMYDITSKLSIQKIPNWCQKVRALSGDIPIILLGNKLDLDNSRLVSKRVAEIIQEENKIASFIEISLKTGENIDLAFKEVARVILENLGFLK